MSLDVYSSYIKTGNVGSDGGRSYSFYYLQLFMVNWFKCIRDVATLVYIHEITPTKIWLFFGRWKPQNGANSPGEESKVSEDPFKKILVVVRMYSPLMTWFFIDSRPPWQGGLKFCKMNQGNACENGQRPDPGGRPSATIRSKVPVESLWTGSRVVS